MRYSQIVESSNIDPVAAKKLALRVWGDGTFPAHKLTPIVAKFRNSGQKAEFSNKEFVDDIANSFFSELEHEIDISNTWLELKLQPEYKTIVRWIADKYIKGFFNFEDATGQGISVLDRWLVVKNQLTDIRPPAGTPTFPTNLDRVPNLKLLNNYLRIDFYSKLFNQVQQKYILKRAQQQAKEIVLIQTPDIKVAIPLNYGSCYLFNNEVGYNASYCTGSSTGLSWFDRYKKQGLILQITDIKNIDREDGKWQIHAPTYQVKNGSQTYLHINKDGTRISSFKYFKELFPVLLREILKALTAKREEIEPILKEYYFEDISVNDEIAKLVQLFSG
jgi:hypothetical protein